VHTDAGERGSQLQRPAPTPGPNARDCPTPSRDGRVFSQEPVAGQRIPVPPAPVALGADRFVRVDSIAVPLVSGTPLLLATLRVRRAGPVFAPLALAVTRVDSAHGATPAGRITAQRPPERAQAVRDAALSPRAARPPHASSRDRPYPFTKTQLSNVPPGMPGKPVCRMNSGVDETGRWFWSSR